MAVAPTYPDCLIPYGELPADCERHDPSRYVLEMLWKKAIAPKEYLYKRCRYCGLFVHVSYAACPCLSGVNHPGVPPPHALKMESNQLLVDNDHFSDLQYPYGQVPYEDLPYDAITVPFDPHMDPEMFKSLWFYRCHNCGRWVPHGGLIECHCSEFESHPEMTWFAADYVGELPTPSAWFGAPCRNNAVDAEFLHIISDFRRGEDTLYEADRYIICPSCGCWNGASVQCNCQFTRYCRENQWWDENYAQLHKEGRCWHDEEIKILHGRLTARAMRVVRSKTQMLDDDNQ